MLAGKFKRRGIMLRALAVFAALLCQISFCFSLNVEGTALLRFKDRIISDPYNALASWKSDDGNSTTCSWSGVHCSSGGEVVALELGDLCLEGILGPELGQLTYLKSLILRNNSFSGIIPEQIGKLKELEVLDLGHNNFTGPLPHDIGNIPSLSILLLDNNNYLGEIARVHKSDANAKLASLSSKKHRKVLHQGEGKTGPRRFLKGKKHREKLPVPPSLAPSSPHNRSRHHSPPRVNATFITAPVPAAAPSSEGSRSSNNHLVLILVVVIGFSTLSVIAFVVFRKRKVVSVWSWTRGLGGHMEEKLIPDVKVFDRSNLGIACEGFINVLGTLCDGTAYKGNLIKRIDNEDKHEYEYEYEEKEEDEYEDEEDYKKHRENVPIAVTSTAVTSATDWSESLEARFKKKIDTLSRVNHKNFVNLIGYCEKEEPFTRMTVFEYAPNGTLFEHLHGTEEDSEHLDWSARLRIAMGIAYCLEYMHQLRPPIAHWNLQSSSIYLTDDLAAKISDFSLWNKVIAEKIGSETMKLLETPSTDPENNVYSFGMILFELITGLFPPFSADEALHCFNNGKPLRDIVDPRLDYFKEEDTEKLAKLAELVKDCLSPVPEERPRMREIVTLLKEITGLEPDAASPNPRPSNYFDLEVLEVKFDLGQSSEGG